MHDVLSIFHVILSLFCASLARQVEQVVARGDLASLNEADRHGQTPLHLACYKVMRRTMIEEADSVG